MRLTSLQIAMIKNALATLEQRRDYRHSMALIRRVAGLDAAMAVRDLHKELIIANKSRSRRVDLSADARAYDLEVRKLVVLGRLAQGSANGALQKHVNEASERLEERFEERVPEVDRPKFLKSEGDLRTWDERWSFMEFRPPLLSPEFSVSFLEHPMNVAQRTVLSDLANSDTTQHVEDARRRLESTLKLVRSTE